MVWRVSRVTTSAKLVRNTLANGLGGVAGVAIAVLLTPFLITQLGLDAYGVWTLALTLSFAGGYAALSDLGVEAATVRFVAEAFADHDDDRISELVATTLAFFAAIGLMIGGAVVIAAGVLTDLFSVEAPLRHDATIVFALVGAQLVFEMPARALAAVLEGTQRFVTFQAAELTRAGVLAAATIGVLLGGGGIVGLGIAYAATSAATFCVYWVLAHRAVPGLHAAPWHASWTEFRRLVSYGTSVFTLRFTGTLYRQMDKAILGIATNPRLVGLYEVANKIHLAASLVQSMSVSALAPAAAQSRRDPHLLRDMYLRGTCYTVAASLPVTLGALVFAQVLLRDWIGPEAVPATDAARLFLAYLTIMVFHNVGTTMLVALGRLRRLLVITVAMTVVNLVVSIALVGRLEITGVLLGTLVASVLGWGPILALCLRSLDVGAGQWVRRVLLPLVPGIAVELIVAGGLLAAVDGAHSLALDAVALLASVVASLAAFTWLGLGAVERRVLFATVRRAMTGATEAPAESAEEPSTSARAPAVASETDLAPL